MKTKYAGHTAGPWSFEDDGVAPRRSPTLIHEPSGEYVAEARFGFHREGERWANATLIADAPSLLAVACELREAAVAHTSTAVPQWGPGLRKAIAAFDALMAGKQTNAAQTKEPK